MFFGVTSFKALGKEIYSMRDDVSILGGIGLEPSPLSWRYFHIKKKKKKKKKHFTLGSAYLNLL